MCYNRRAGDSSQAFKYHNMIPKMNLKQSMPTPDVRRRAGMLPPRHTGVAWGQRPSRSLAGSLAALAVFAVAGLTGLTPARGQAAPETATPQRAGAGADAGGRKVDAADARQLHALVQRWIDDGGLPPQDPGPIVVRDAVGVAVIMAGILAVQRARVPTAS